MAFRLTPEDLPNDASVMQDRFALGGWRVSPLNDTVMALGVLFLQT